MSAQDDRAEAADEAERQRLRRIGVWSIGAIAGTLIVITLVLVGTGGSDSRDSILIIGGSARLTDLSKGETVRVTGQVRNALSGSRFGGDRNDSNAVEASKIERAAAGGDAGGTAKIKKVRDDDGLRGRTVTVVGEVLGDSGGDIFSIAEP